MQIPENTKNYFSDSLDEDESDEDFKLECKVEKEKALTKLKTQKAPEIYHKPFEEIEEETRNALVDETLKSLRKKRLKKI